MKKLIALLICLTLAFSCLSVQAAAAGSRVKERRTLRQARAVHPVPV